MYKNPIKVKELEEQVEAMRQKYNKLVDEMYHEKQLVPEGYILIGAGDLVKEGAIAFEPHHKRWWQAGNSVGKTLNDKGFVSGITHNGWKYANPI